ncbi:MAG: hypothetical protein ABIT10_12920 [Alteraurantiacibacter sp.]
MDSLDAVQLGKVQEFRKRVQAAGCLTRDFLDDATLINAITLILDRFANTWASAPDATCARSELGAPLDEELPRTEESKNIIDQDDDRDIGVLDALEEFEKSNSRFVELTDLWNNGLNRITQTSNNTAQQLSEISKFGKPDASQVRSIISHLSSEMEEFADKGEDNISELEVVMQEISKKAIVIIDLSQDFDEPTEDLIGAQDALSRLEMSISEANISILDLINTMEKSPRLDKKLNRANRRVIDIHKRFAEKSRLFRDDILLCLDDLNQRIAALNTEA